MITTGTSLKLHAIEIYKCNKVALNIIFLGTVRS
jgi:hypothetical protein